MISRRTGWLIWGSLLLPIAVLIEIKTFEIPLPAPSFLLPFAVHHYHPSWHVTATLFSGIGGLSILMIPFSLIRDFATNRKKLR